MTSTPTLYVINLDRRPERLAHFRAECQRENVPTGWVRVWQAVDAMSHEWTPTEKQWFAKSDLDLNSETGRGCAANQLSHVGILREIAYTADVSSFFVVFQDDVRLGEHFREGLETVLTEMRKHSTDLVWIGLHKIGAGSYFEDLDLEQQPSVDTFFADMISPHLGHLHPTVNPASLAYVITPVGAQKYLNYVEKTGGFLHATDINYRDYLLGINQFIGCYPLLCTGNSTFKSDIFKYDNHATARDLLELLS